MYPLDPSGNLTYVAIENCPFIVDLPIRKGDFSKLFEFTRGYIIVKSSMMITIDVIPRTKVIPSPLGGLVLCSAVAVALGNCSLREIQSKQLETTLKKRLSMALKPI